VFCNIRCAFEIFLNISLSNFSLLWIQLLQLQCSATQPWVLVTATYVLRDSGKHHIYIYIYVCVCVCVCVSYGSCLLNRNLDHVAYILHTSVYNYQNYRYGYKNIFCSLFGTPHFDFLPKISPWVSSPSKQTPG